MNHKLLCFPFDDQNHKTSVLAKRATGLLVPFHIRVSRPRKLSNRTVSYKTARLDVAIWPAHKPADAGPRNLSRLVL